MQQVAKYHLIELHQPSQTAPSLEILLCTVTSIRDLMVIATSCQDLPRLLKLHQEFKTES